MEKIHNHVNTRNTPQTQAVMGKNMSKNNAGGYGFAIDNWQQLARFLVLGTSGGTYYVNERKLTKDNAEAVQKCIEEDGIRTVNEIVDISVNGRAPKNDYALFALAMCSAADNLATRQAAFAALPKVARTGTHLFNFAAYREAFAGWGRGMRTAVANWYNDKNIDKLAYQMIKYQQRDGWSHKDLLRLSHPKAVDAQHDALYAYAVGKEAVYTNLPEIVVAFEGLNADSSKSDVINKITDYGLTREMIPTQFLKDADVWAALLENMPLTAMIRNLGNMSKVGLLTPMSDTSKLVVEKLGNEEHLRKSRVHPLQVLVAMSVYSQGHGAKGSGSWTVVPKVTDALDDAFYAAFGNIESTGKRWVLGLDVSGSMTWGDIAGMPGITPNVASAAMAMVTARTESDHYIMGFASDFRDLGISPKMTLKEAMRKTQSMSFGSTNCALPMQWALKNKVKSDVFVVYTDSETYAGRGHPFQALNEYREKMGIDAKLIVVGMVSNGFSIADPNDPGMLDVVGFDTAVPNVMSQFVMS